MKEILIESIKTSLIDKDNIGNKEFEHKLLSNSSGKIIVELRKYLENSDEFVISVAFITESGVLLLLDELEKLDKKGIKGKILTGDYLNFTEPKALEKLLTFKNIELKVLENRDFHAKGYFFRKGEIWTIIVGSSNLTQKALTVNLEWNLKINSLSDGKIVKNIMDEFLENFKIATVVNETYIQNYKKRYEELKKIKNIYSIGKEIKIKPNTMQKNSLENLKHMRENEKRALLISATGTGKTYISAFDVKNSKPKKMLFIAHRKKILESAVKSYKNIIKDKKISLYEENKNADYIFAMVQTLSRDKHLQQFSKDEFDYIVIDEVHHSGAQSYLKIIDYFEPKFLLGMTATPERSDDFDIYSLFDNNIAYEIRLYDALKEELLTPFHYFGISDILIDGEEIDEKTNVKNLILDERVDNIIEKSQFYGYSGEKLRGLIFVSHREEAKILADKLSERGIKSKSLLGDDSDNYREKIIQELENGEISYIVTVDIFNEGVDIPSLNQIILLRPTNSAIVYIQQLGRGLRKYHDKEYVVILDFIGNYEKNFLIPVAISQDNSYNKDSIKQFLINGINSIPGESTIIFDEIVQEKIIENINKTNFSTKRNIEKDFRFLEKKLGKIPYLSDFFKNNLIEPSIILKYKKTYDEVLRIFKPNYKFQNISKDENNYLRFLYGFFTPVKRIHEIEVLKYLLKNKKIDLKEFTQYIEKKYKILFQKENVINALKHFTKEIFQNLSTIKPYLPIVAKNGDYYILEKEFENSYIKNSYFKKLVDDIIEYNFLYVDKYYKQYGEKSILKYREYSKQEAFWYLNLDFNNGYQVSGYTTFEEEKRVVLFITLEDTPPFSKYNNVFYDNKTFTWYSKEKRVLKRKDKLTIEGKISENYYTLEVFIKKKSGENFYYIGEVLKVLKAKEIINSKGNQVVEYILELKDGIADNLFAYFMRIY